MRLKLTVAYDGTAVPRLGAPARRAHRRGRRSPRRSRAVYGSAERLAVAGRTDTGVHALANVVSVDVEGGPPPERAAEALNAVLPAGRGGRPRRRGARPASTRVTRRARAPTATGSGGCAPARRSRSTARSGIRGRSTSSASRPPLRCSSASTTSAPSRRPTRSTTSSSAVVEDARWHDRGDAVEFEITADSFLRHMVRTLVGTMLERDPDDVLGLLQGAPRSAAGSTAPAVGPLPGRGRLRQVPDA